MSYPRRQRSFWARIKLSVKKRIPIELGKIPTYSKTAPWDGLVKGSFKLIFYKTNKERTIQFLLIAITYFLNFLDFRRWRIFQRPVYQKSISVEGASVNPAERVFRPFNWRMFAPTGPRIFSQLVQRTVSCGMETTIRNIFSVNRFLKNIFAPMVEMPATPLFMGLYAW